MGVRVRFREVSAYGRLKIQSFSRKIAGTAVWCLLMGGVHLWEMSVSADSTVHIRLRNNNTSSRENDGTPREKGSVSREMNGPIT